MLETDIETTNASQPICLFPQSVVLNIKAESLQKYIIFIFKLFNKINKLNIVFNLVNLINPFNLVQK